MKHAALYWTAFTTIPLLMSSVAEAAPVTLVCTIADGPRAGQTFEMAIDEAASTVNRSPAVFTAHEIRWGEGDRGCEGRRVTGACLLYKTPEGWGMKSPVSPDSDEFRNANCVSG